MVMARTTERFVLHTRWITAFFAVILAFTLQVDSLRLIERLRTDSELRARLVQSSDSVLQKAEDTLAKTAEQKALASAAIVTVMSLDRFIAQYNQRFDEATKMWLADLGTSVGGLKDQIKGLDLGLVPPLPSLERYKQDYGSKRHLAGTFMSSLLLSLGAPFWFNALRQLANLRPILAGKVESQGS